MKKLDITLSCNQPDLLSEITHDFGKSIGLKRKEQFTTLGVLLLNLKSSEKVLVPRAKNSLGDSRYNPYKIGPSSLRTALDRLEESKYIKQEIGSIKGGDLKRTKVKAYGNLHERLKRDYNFYQDVKILKGNIEPLVLKIKKPKHTRLIGYEDNKRTNLLRADLNAYNEVISNCELSIPNADGFDDYYYQTGERVRRSFIHTSSNHNFEYGGRMYGSWCDLGNKSRGRLLIDGFETIEIDYSASTINTIYIEATGKPYQSGDPYELVIGDFLIPRSIVKKVGNIMLFCSSIAGSVKATENVYKKLNEKDRHKQEYLDTKLNVTIEQVCTEYLKKHNKISDYFLGGKSVGLFCQYLESERVMNVANHFTQEGIPILTVYDSFIVDMEYEDKLRECMYH
ncbi:MAG: hypothetical protein KC478_13505 [Bacteriovoracaceae bacterium]|nr:hypothetical protein [Bacteriovoracaceae bacterium]